MKFIIDSTVFEGEEGKRILKLKYRECPYPELLDSWDDIIPPTFEDIVRDYGTVNKRRVAFRYFGIEKLMEELKPQVVSSSRMRKIAYWVDPHGKRQERVYYDTYEIMRADWKPLLPEEVGDEEDPTRRWAYLVRFHDTSIDKVYVLWVDLGEANNNQLSNKDFYFKYGDWSNKMLERMVSPISAIASTIRVTFKEGDIRRIIRQGDCILVKPVPGAIPYSKDDSKTDRMLTEAEYREFLRLES